MHNTSTFRVIFPMKNKECLGSFILLGLDPQQKVQHIVFPVKVEQTFNMEGQQSLTFY